MKLIRNHRGEKWLGKGGSGMLNKKRPAPEVTAGKGQRPPNLNRPIQGKGRTGEREGISN